MADLSNVGLYLSVVRDNENKEQNLDENYGLVSIPNKYVSQIHPVSLQAGKYFLLLTSSPLKQRKTTIRFQLDFLEMVEVRGKDLNAFALAAPELCALPSMPRSFQSPSLLHVLTGEKMSFVRGFRLVDIHRFSGIQI